MTTPARPVCPNPNCGRMSGYIRMDGTYRCQRCGYDGPARTKDQETLKEQQGKEDKSGEVRD